MKKIPGIVPPPPKCEIDGKITNLSSKTLAELFELRDRQLKLLKNKGFINRLPDKGAKIQELHNKILKAIKSREEEENVNDLLENLNLNNDSVQNIEWEGKLVNNENTYLDSDDDSDPEDVLQILSQQTAQDKKLKVLQQETPLVTPEDLINIGEIPHVKYLVEKAEQNIEPKPTGHFKPYKTTKTDVHRPEKEVHRKKHKHWEVTAATPPPILHGPVKVLSLDESLKLQKEYNKHLQEIQIKYATEKLMSLKGIQMIPILDTSKFNDYREPESDNSAGLSDIEESEEVHDEEPEKGGVVFTVMK